jgi:prepilin-type N-terminal cleavage/methylation domain-containing protein
MERRGFTLVELLIVVVIIGTMAAFAVPLISRGMDSRRVSGARIAITTLNAKARALAVQRSRTVRLVINGNEIKLISTAPVTGAQTISDRRDLYAVYGVTVTASRDTLSYDPRGIGLQTSTTSIVVSRPGVSSDSVLINSIGGILR